MHVCEVASVVSLSATPVACQAPLGFPRQDYWSGLPCPPPGDLPHPVLKPTSPALQADFLLLTDSLPLSYQGSPGEYNILLLKRNKRQMEKVKWNIIYKKKCDFHYVNPEAWPC